MVRTADRDDIDILATDQISIVFAGERSAAESSLGLISYMAINITNGSDVAVELCFVSNDTPLIPQSDRTDSLPVE